jgi:hypothetical protein
MNLYKTYDGIENLSIFELVEWLFEYLDYTEESDGGRIFHPVTISCCRAMMHEPLDQLLKELKSRLS